MRLPVRKLHGEVVGLCRRAPKTPPEDALQLPSNLTFEPDMDLLLREHLRLSCVTWLSKMRAETHPELEQCRKIEAEAAHISLF
jgi:hypothetical protein